MEKCNDSTNSRKHTEETKKIISEKRKEYLRNNPDKLSWAGKNRKIESVPEANCRKVIEEMYIANIHQNYNDPEWDRFFSIDFANIENKIGIEVNGAQHYNRDGTLAEYYQKKHDYLIEKGWKISEVLYTEFYNTDNIKKIINETLVSNAIYSSDAKVINDKLERSIAKKEAKEKITLNTLSRLKRRKVTWPTKEEMILLLNNYTLEDIARKYGVTSSTVKKWCKSYNIKSLGKKSLTIIKLKSITIQELILLLEIKPLSKIAKEFKLTHTTLRNYIKDLGLVPKPSSFWSKKKL